VPHLTPTDTQETVLSEVLNRPKNYDGVAAIKMLMQPKSIAVIGVSSKPGTAGRTVLANLKVNNYAGQVYVVAARPRTSTAIRFSKASTTCPRASNSPSSPCPAGR
jgi:hypothetical protein